MTTDAEHAAATALFTAVGNRGDAPRLDQEALFDLYQQCLEAIRGERRPTRTMHVSTQCPACNAPVEIALVVPVA